MNMSKHVFNLLLIPLILGTLVVACSSDETSESSSPVPEPDPVIEVDNTKPNVVANALVPSNGSTGVLIGTSVKFAFDEPIDVTSVTTADDFTCGATVQLSANNFLSCVPMRSDYDARNDNRSFTVYPVDYLDYNTKYELKIKEWIKDTSGNYLPYDIIPLVFTTVPENTVTFVDKILVDFENKLRLAGGYSLVNELRSVDRKGEGLTITVIDSILKGVRDELTNKSLNNSDDLIKVLESMLTGSIKGLDIAKISDSTRRKEILSDICSELVATIPGREKFYTENKSEIVKSLMNTGVSELSGKVTNEEIPEAIGGLLQGFILSLGTLEFSELERVNQVIPDLLKRTIITADTVYSSSGNTFWNTTIEHMSSAMVSGMNQWDDWGGMESKWDDHLSTGLTGI
ncbi:MAG: Ig-like domain-containing protein, partial [SAR324 cluster bacterium]|nr:Ig-like domain-containing protein [SAR324 cluster bacterium]